MRVLLMHIFPSAAEQRAQVGEGSSFASCGVCMPHSIEELVKTKTAAVLLCVLLSSLQYLVVSVRL